MTPTANPRHPWKALAVVLAMFAAVHGVRAHSGGHAPVFEHVTIGHSSSDDDASSDDDCPDIDVRFDGDDIRIHDGALDDGRVIDVFDGAEWS
jgi:hypothetical protein